jgi:hypothetical protein
MNKYRLSACAVLAALAITGTLLAQRVQKLDKNRASPDDVVTSTVGGKKVTVEYSRPSMKGRQIFGGLVPNGKPWRTGANETTLLTLEGDFMVGKIHAPKGTYGVYTIPDEKSWTLALSKTATGMGEEFDQAQDIGRTPMKVSKAAAPVEQFTISITPSGGKQGTLKFAWDTTEATVDLTAH